MKKYLLAPAFILATIFLLMACAKETSFPQAGGELPGQNITIQADGSFSPAILTVASGTTVSFVNNHNKPHNIKSSDSVSIVTNLIAPYKFYKFNTSGLTGVYDYKCLLDTSIRGSLIVTP